MVSLKHKVKIHISLRTINQNLDLQLTENELDPIHGICYPKYGKPRPIIVMHGAKLEANYL